MHPTISTHLRNTTFALSLALLTAPAAAAAVYEPPTVGGGALSPRAPEPKSGEDAVKVSIAVVGEAKPSATVRLVATFDIVPGWHIYWENPGESGSATDIALELPGGCTVPLDAREKPAIDFPVPSVFTHGETTFGYESRVTLSIPVTLPPELPAGGLPTKVTTRWLVCRGVCLMGQNVTTVDLVKPVAPDAAPAKDLAASLARVPTPLPATWKVALEDVTEDAATLRIESGRRGPLRFIPFDTPGVALESGYLADSNDGAEKGTQEGATSGTSGGTSTSTSASTSTGTWLVPLTISRESSLGRPLEVGGIVISNDGTAHAFRLPVPKATDTASAPSK